MHGNDWISFVKGDNSKRLPNLVLLSFQIWKRKSWEIKVLQGNISSKYHILYNAQWYRWTSEPTTTSFGLTMMDRKRNEFPTSVCKSIRSGCHKAHNFVTSFLLYIPLPAWRNQRTLFAIILGGNSLFLIPEQMKGAKCKSDRRWNNSRVTNNPIHLT